VEIPSPPLVDPWSGISGGPMGQLWGGGQVGGGHPLQRDFPLGGPIGNLAQTPMGQLGGVRVNTHVPSLRTHVH